MKTVILFISVIIISLPVFSDTGIPEQKLKEANKLYTQNKFDDALKLYEQIISDDYSSPELFYNTANSYYRVNKIGKAIYYYEKAKLLNPNDDDINYNLELAKLRVKNLPPEVPKIFPVRVFMQIAFWKSGRLWGRLSLVFFLVFLGIAYFYFTAKNPKAKKIRLLTAIIILFFSISTFVFMQYNLSVMNAHNKAIITKNEVVAKSSPNNSANDLFKVYEGYKVKIETRNGNWCEIKLTDGRKAWINNEDLMVL